MKPDCRRRSYLWVLDAFEPTTGMTLALWRVRRRSQDFIDLLEAVVEKWPSNELIPSLDNLSIHRGLDVQLWALAHERIRFLFQPTYAPWLNLIEPWWKALRSLALAGRRFEDIANVRSSIAKSTDYWNGHRQPYVWRKTEPSYLSCL